MQQIKFKIKKTVTLIAEQRKMILQFFLTALFIGIGIWFFHHEEVEISKVKDELANANALLVLSGIIITAIYIVTHGFMYRAAFSSLYQTISVKTGVILFLKRNFISVFLPAGGVSSLAFFTDEIEKSGISKTKIHFASSLYGFIGIVSAVFIAVPVFVYGLTTRNVMGDEWVALATVVILLAALYFLYRNIIRKGTMYKLIKKYYPSIEVYISDIDKGVINRKQLLKCLLYSLLIEVWGIFHLYLSARALGMPIGLMTCATGYIIAVVFMIISPFMRGLGAVEFTLGFTLTRFGFTTIEAVSITALYRFFEFWLPLLAGLLSFIAKANKFLMRILPAALLFILGVINIISVVTPAISERLHLLRNYLPREAIHASNYFVLASGLFLLVNAAFMLKGLRTAWWFALLLSLGSLIGHLTKAIDYEEAIIAFVVVLSLFSTRKEYVVKSNPRLRGVGIQTALISMAAAMIYGVVGFYFLDIKHFKIDFSLAQSVKYTLANFFLIGSPDLVPSGQFTRYFIGSIQISGFLSLGFLIFTLIAPYVWKNEPDETEFNDALALVKISGNSAMDYFKTYRDKLLFFNERKNCVISYKVSGNFAVILENPVAENKEAMIQILLSFYAYCSDTGLKSISYRVPAESLEIYKGLRKKSLFLGQEAIVDLNTFTLQGGNKKSMRNALNKVTERGFKARIFEPPLKEGLMQKLKAVSDEWLLEMERKELVFSQGMFHWSEIKNQTVITVENEEEKVIGFLNIIPDYASNEGTYDLIRKTSDAPNGVMDFMLVELFNYFKKKNIQYVNLGFAPLSGIETPEDITERSMKFAYEKIKSFSHYKGLREYKEKFNPVWHDKYLIYEHDFDLLQIPSLLTKIIKP
ncbi:MAG: phosphatidylglycerol lysyltransferase domain-containing protein [Bacteroidales bacterium]